MSRAERELATVNDPMGGHMRQFWVSFRFFFDFAFSKRKLCNGENFRIKDFDEFRCF